MSDKLRNIMIWDLIDEIHDRIEDMKHLGLTDKSLARLLTEDNKAESFLGKIEQEIASVQSSEEQAA